MKLTSTRWTLLATEVALLVCAFISGCGRGDSVADTNSGTTSLHPSQRTVVVDGIAIAVRSEDEFFDRADAGNVQIDAATGKFLLTAYHCTNPNCVAEGKNGRPLLFTRRVPGMRVGEDGRADWKEADDDYLMANPLPKCPACGQMRGVEVYLPPESQARRDQLLAELADARAQRRAARQAGEPLNGIDRNPMKIMSEIASLPKLYLRDDGE